MYTIFANLVHRELRNTTFEGEKMPTSITFPDSDYMTRSEIKNYILLAHRKLNVNFECPFAEGRGVGADEASPLQNVLLVYHDFAKGFESGLSDVLELLQVRYCQ